MKRYADLGRKSGFQPWQFEALRLWVAGVPVEEIAWSVEQQLTIVQKLVKSKPAKVLIATMQDGLLDTVKHVQVNIQALAPKALERMSALIDSKNELVAARASMWVLEAAGHTPLRRLEIQHRLDSDDMEDMTVEQLRARAIERITGQKAIETTATREEQPDERKIN